MHTLPRTGRRLRPHGRGLADALGWFSIGLGVAELLAPGPIARAIGMQGKTSLLRSYGVREIATGVAILTSADKAPWVWGRVGGDALDMATVAALGHKRGRSSVALGALAGVAAIDYACALQLESARSTPRRAVRNYLDRSGFPKPPAQMRGAARADARPAIDAGQDKSTAAAGQAAPGA